MYTKLSNKLQERKPKEKTKQPTNNRFRTLLQLEKLHADWLKILTADWLISVTKAEHFLQKYTK